MYNSLLILLLIGFSQHSYGQSGGSPIFSGGSPAAAAGQTTQCLNIVPLGCVLFGANCAPGCATTTAPTTTTTSTTTTTTPAPSTCRWGAGENCEVYTNPSCPAICASCPIACKTAQTSGAPCDATCSAECC